MQSKRRATSAVKPSQKTSSVYEIVTERIIKELEQGHAPWRKPWSAAWAPKNFVSHHDYRGINHVLLSSEVGRRECPYFATKRQIDKLGGRIQSDQWKKSNIVTWWSLLKRSETEGEKGGKAFPILRYYRVWNLSQVDGVEWSVPDETPIDPIEECEAVVTQYDGKPDIHYDGGNEAFYRSALDSVHMPIRDAFFSSEEYYATLFHELVHSTGHSSRLKREMKGGKYSKPYAREELCAEMGSALLLGVAGIEEDPLRKNSAAYLRGWIDALTDDPRCVAVACGKAQKAADWILGKREADVREAA